MQVVSEISEFFGGFLKNPGLTGSLVPSSRFLSRSLVQSLENSSPLLRGRRVVELGPGTGGVTQYILNTLSPEDTFLGLELNENFISSLETRFSTYPQAHFAHDSAENLTKHAQSGAFDYVVSSLPWSLFGESLREDILKAIQASLTPQGEWVTYFYLSAMPIVWRKKIIRQFRTYFSSVSSEEVIWANFPPAIVFRMKI